jgi:acyl-CoA synthetase (AMP-forming)/AMP-acid ligase II
VTVWSRLFESPVFTKAETKGITNAATGERITYRELKQHAEHLSTALVRRHGLRASDTVVLLSPNTVWYPVAMHATLRAGRYSETTSS